MTWLVGLITFTSPLWCQYLANKFPSWTESESGISSVAIYGYLMIVLALFVGHTMSDETHIEQFQQYCEEKSKDIYICDFRSSLDDAPQPDGDWRRGY